VELKTLSTSCFLKILGASTSWSPTALPCPALPSIGIDVYWVSAWFDPRVLIVVGERILGCQVYLAESNQAENTG
jgi:hypothetical protein